MIDSMDDEWQKERVQVRTCSLSFAEEHWNFHFNKFLLPLLKVHSQYRFLYNYNAHIKCGVHYNYTAMEILSSV